MDHRCRQRGQHHLGVGGRDEHVDVDVDRAPRPLRAPGESERATEGVRQPGTVERIMHRDDLVGERDSGHRGTRRREPAPPNA